MATRHPTARRARHEQVDSDDAFIAKILELTAWGKANSRLLVGAFAVVMVLASALLYYRNHQANIRQQAAIQMQHVRQTVASGNRALAVRDLEAFVANFGATAEGEEARLILAQVYLAEGEAQKAADAVAGLAEKATSMTQATAAFLLAAAQEASNDSQKAETTYLRIAERAEMPFQRRDALDQAARLRSERGDAAGAGQLYQRLLDTTTDNTPERALYQLRLAEALEATAG